MVQTRLLLLFLLESVIVQTAGGEWGMVGWGGTKGEINTLMWSDAS